MLESLSTEINFLSAKIEDKYSRDDPDTFTATVSLLFKCVYNHGYDASYCNSHSDGQ